MFLEVLFFLLVGILIGILFGLLPGVHPNIIVLFIPLLASLNMEVTFLLALIVSVAVANSITSFLPSILLGVPDSGNELAILPGHRMLLSGQGYQAVKLTVTGSIGAVIFCAVVFPLLALAIPFLFHTLGSYIYLFLITIAAIMILTEDRKLVALAIFFAAGSIGLLSPRLPVDNTLILFPVFSGFFGLSMLLLQMRNKVKMPVQTNKEVYVPKGTINRSVLSGSIAGVFSGLLPGVGASELASIASIGKSEHAFLVRIGAITTANIILSILGLWLIGRSRSGLAVVVDQLTNIGFAEVLTIIIISLIAGGLSSAFALKAAKLGIRLVQAMGYDILSKGTVLFITMLTYIFAGFYGLLLLFVCTALGMLTNLVNAKRGLLMGVLLVPTVLYYLKTA